MAATTTSKPSPERRRGIRTWSNFGEIRRVPSEYEIVTHGANYTARKDKNSPLEGNPTSPVNMWYLTYRDKSPLTVDDWDGFRDPDEITYRKYVTMQDEAETVVEAILDQYTANRDGYIAHDASLAPEWVKTLATLYTPMRYPNHAIQMSQSYIADLAPTSYINNAAAFGAADQLRLVSLVAYRSRQLQMAHPDAGFATGERAIWETHPAWQPITWLLTSNLAIDADRNARWSAAVARYAISKRPENAAVLKRWVDRWTPRADKAAAALATLLADLPKVPRDAETTMAAAKQARERVLANAGLA